MVLFIKNILILVTLLLLKKLRQVLKHLNLKLVIELVLLRTRIFLVKVSPKIGPKKIFFFDSILKTNHESIDL